MVTRYVVNQSLFLCLEAWEELNFDPKYLESETELISFNT